MSEKQTLDHFKNFWEIWMGRHSNIPDCCIAYFIGLWIDSAITLRYADPLYKTWCEVQKEKGVGFGEYVPCEKCLRKPEDMRQLHKCGPECRKESRNARARHRYWFRGRAA